MSKLQQRLFRQYLDQATDGAQGGASGSGSIGTNTDVDAKIAEAVNTAVAGLKAKNSELIGDNKRLKDEVRANVERFSGIDPDRVRALLQRIETDEETKLLAEGKIDEVFTKRTERMRAEFERQLTEAKGHVETANKKADAFQQRMLDNAILVAAGGKVHEHAHEDVLFRSRGQFGLDDRGDAVRIGEDGKPVFGKDGKTPMRPPEWIEGLRSNAPHLFPGQAGSGAQNSTGRTNSKDLSHLPPTERMTAARAMK